MASVKQLFSNLLTERSKINVYITVVLWANWYFLASLLLLAQTAVLFALDLKNRALFLFLASLLSLFDFLEAKNNIFFQIN